MQIIPVSANSNQTFSILLDGQACTFKIYWRQTRLYLDLLVGDEVIVRGFICVNRANILQRVKKGFNGSLHFWDNLGDDFPYYKDLNSRYFLIFMSVDEELPEVLKF